MTKCTCVIDLHASCCSVTSKFSLSNISYYFEVLHSSLASIYWHVFIVKGCCWQFVSSSVLFRTDTLNVKGKRQSACTTNVQLVFWFYLDFIWTLIWLNVEFNVTVTKNVRIHQLWRNSAQFSSSLVLIWYEVYNWSNMHSKSTFF